SSTKAARRQLYCGEFHRKVIHSSRPRARGDAIFENRGEKVGEMKLRALAARDAREPLAFIKRQLSGAWADARAVNKFPVGIDVAAPAFVNPKQFPGLQLDAQLLADLAHQRLFGCLAGLHVAAEKIPMVGKRDLGLGV